MNADHSSHWWQALKQGISTHKAAAIVSVLGTVLGAAVLSMWDAARKGLLYSIEHFLQPCIGLLAIGAIAFAVDKWFLWKRMAGLALDKASKVDELKGLFEAERHTSSMLRAQLDKTAKPKDSNRLTSDYERIVTLILGAGEMTVNQLVFETGETEPNLVNRVRYLSLSLQFTYRLGMRGSEAVYALTDRGKEYARENEIMSVQQSMQALP